MAKKKKAAKSTSAKALPKIKPAVPDEEIAYRIVKLYFEEVARLGFKRTLNLDSILNAYFYSLKRLMNKEIELATIEKIVKETEVELKTETKEEILPQMKPKEPIDIPKPVPK